MLVFHVPQHHEFVQMTKIDALWTSHLFRPLVDHPEHLVVRGGVRGSMALEVRAGHNLPTDVVLLAAPDLAKLWSHTVGFVVPFQVLSQFADPLDLSTVVHWTDRVPPLVDDVPHAPRDSLLFLHPLWEHVKSAFHQALCTLLRPGLPRCRM